MSVSSKCGPHIELISNDAAHVTRCSCGTVHVHLHGNGVTIRLEPEQLKHVSNALSAATRLIDYADNVTAVSPSGKPGPMN